MKYMIFCDGEFVRFVGDADSALYLVKMANNGAKMNGYSHRYEVRVAVGG